MYCVAWNEEDVGDARLLKHGYLICTDVFCWFQPWNHWKRLKNVGKKCFDQLLGVGSTQKLVEIHNKWVHESKWQYKQYKFNNMKTGFFVRFMMAFEFYLLFKFHPKWHSKCHPKPGLFPVFRHLKNFLERGHSNIWQVEVQFLDSPFFCSSRYFHMKKYQSKVKIAEF